MRYTRAFVLSAAFGVLVLTALAFYGDAPRLWETAQRYPLPLLVPVLLLTSANYALRWLKWRYYLHLVGARQVRPSDSLLIFLSGFAMGLTPGKIGEIVKPYLLRDRYGVPLSRTTPIPLAERLSDGIALIVLASAGVLAYGTGLAGIVGLVMGAAAALAVLRSARLTHAVVQLSSRLPLVGKRVDTVRTLLASAAILLDWHALAFAVGLGVISWGCEALAFFLVLSGLEIPPSPALLLQATFALASATLFGSASLMPGGLGVAEASLTGFLELVVGLGRTPAVYATLVIRLCTLWFGVALGTAALLWLLARQGGTAVPVGQTAAEPVGRG